MSTDLPQYSRKFSHNLRRLVTANSCSFPHTSRAIQHDREFDLTCWHTPLNQPLAKIDLKRATETVDIPAAAIEWPCASARRRRLNDSPGMSAWTDRQIAAAGTCGPRIARQARNRQCSARMASTCPSVSHQGGRPYSCGARGVLTASADRPCSPALAPPELLPHFAPKLA